MMTCEKEAADVQIELTLNMADIEGEDLIAEFYRRWPWNAEDEIKTLMETREVQNVDAIIVARLRAWLGSE